MLAPLPRLAPAIGVVITVAVVTSGVLNALGWGVVVVYLFFTAGSAYLLLEELRRSAAPAVPAL